MEINGMPAHALLVHGAVVFGPVAGLLAVAYAFPALRERLRGVTLVTAVLAAVFVVLAYLSGDSYLEDNPALSNIPAVDTHEDRAAFALWVTLAFSALAVAATTLRTGRAARVLPLLAAVGGVATVVAVALTGDAGAQAVWGG
jgi:hypothetical protein